LFPCQGEAQTTVDGKGRITLKSPYREHVPSKLYLMRDVDGCLRVLDKHAWDAVAARFASMDPMSPETALVERFYIAGTAEVTVDPADGRVRIPEKLLQWLGATDDDRQVTIVPKASHLELWLSSRYDAYLEQNAEDGTLRDLALSLFAGGRQRQDPNATAIEDDA